MFFFEWKTKSVLEENEEPIVQWKKKYRLYMEIMKEISFFGRLVCLFACVYWISHADKGPLKGFDPIEQW